MICECTCGCVCLKYFIIKYDSKISLKTLYVLGIQQNYPKIRSPSTEECRKKGK